jgi:hypothetical protein
MDLGTLAYANILMQKKIAKSIIIFIFFVILAFVHY